MANSSHLANHEVIIKSRLEKWRAVLISKSKDEKEYIPYNETQTPSKENKIVENMLEQIGWSGEYLAQAMKETNNMTLDIVKNANEKLIKLAKGQTINPLLIMQTYAESGLFYANQAGTIYNIPIVAIINFFKFSNSEIYNIMFACIDYFDNGAGIIFNQCVNLLKLKKDSHLNHFLEDISYLITLPGQVYSITLSTIVTCIYIEYAKTKNTNHRKALIAFSHEISQTKNKQELLSLFLYYLRSNQDVSHLYLSEIIIEMIYTTPSFYNEISPVPRKLTSGQFIRRPQGTFLHNDEKVKNNERNVLAQIISQKIASIPKFPSSAQPLTTAPSTTLKEVIPDCILPPLKGIILQYYCFSITFINSAKTTEQDQKKVSDLKQQINPHNLFGIHMPIVNDLAEAANNLIWGRIDKLKEILERNQNPLLLTTSILVEDHRGPGVIPAGTLFQKSLYIRDVKMLHAEGETVALMLNRFTRERCCKEEVTKQHIQANQVIEEEKKKNAVLQSDDITTLTTAWDVVTRADEKTLENNSIVKAVIDLLDTQLKKPGNKEVFIEAWKFAERDYDAFGGCNSLRNNFLANRIIGLIALRRFSVPELQIFYEGMYFFQISHAWSITKRIDVCMKLGVGSLPVLFGNNSNDSTNSSVGRFILGFNCHLDSGGVRCSSERSKRASPEYLVSFFRSTDLRAADAEDRIILRI